MSTEQPAAGTPQPIQDVVAPPKTEVSTEASLAEPPAELQFTEVPTDAEPVAVPPAEPSPLPTSPTDVKAKIVETKKQPKPAAGPRKPVGLISIAVLVFIGLAATAYYAYTKTR